MPTRRPPLAALALAVLLAGCRDGGSPAAGPAPAAPAPDVHRYTLRGEIVRLPAPAPAARELSIRHEPIPDFKNSSGAVVGMGAMVMPFGVAPAVPLDGLEPGDKIRFRFAMDWANNTSQIESIEELPRDTALDFAGGAR